MAAMLCNVVVRRRRAHPTVIHAASHADHLTNRFHVAVLLFSNRSQMTSKCGKNKKPDFDVFCDLLPNRRTAAWNLFVLYNKKKTKLPQKKAFFISKSFNTTGEPTFAHSAHFDKHRRKKPFHVIYCLYK